MKTILSTKEFTKLCHRLDHEVSTSLTALLSGVVGIEFEAGTDTPNGCLLAAITPTRCVRLDHVVIPFDHAIVGDYFASLSNAIIVIHGFWRLDEAMPWVMDEAFGEGGQVIVNIPSLDVDQVNASTEVIAAVAIKILNRQLAIC